jgi:hypothetical protein
MTIIFGNRFREEEAIESLKKLRMQNDLRGFICKFRTLLKKVNVGIVMQQSWFLKALPPYLSRNPHDIQQKTLEDLIQDTIESRTNKT